MPAEDLPGSFSDDSGPSATYRQQIIIKFWTRLTTSQAYHALKAWGTARTFYWCVSSCWRCFCHLSFPVSPVSGPSGWSPRGGFCGAAHPTVKQSNTIQVWAQPLFLWERQLGEKNYSSRIDKWPWSSANLCTALTQTINIWGCVNILAHECCRTCFRSKILLVSCILSTFSFRTFTSDPSVSCWNTYSRYFFRNPSQRHQHRTTSVLLHSSKPNSNKTDAQNKSHRHFSNPGDLM